MPANTYGKTKAVYFGEDEMDLVAWVEGKHRNFSKFVKAIIRRNMQIEQEGIDPRVAQMVREMVAIEMRGKVMKEEKAPEDGGEVLEEMIGKLF